MKNFILLLVLISACSTRDIEKEIKSIIGKTYVNMSELIGEVELLDENLFQIQLLPSYISAHLNHHDDNGEYYLVRYIFKTHKTTYRRFYVVDLQSKKIIGSDNDENVFFLPIMKIILGDENAKSVVGDELFKAMSY